MSLPTQIFSSIYYPFSVSLVLTFYTIAADNELANAKPLIPGGKLELGSWKPLMLMLSCFSHVRRARQALGILQERILKWVAMPSSRGSSFLPDPGIELVSLASPALAGRFFTNRTTWEAWEHLFGQNILLTYQYIYLLYVFFYSKMLYLINSINFLALPS